MERIVARRQPTKAVELKDIGPNCPVMIKNLMKVITNTITKLQYMYMVIN